MSANNQVWKAIGIKPYVRNLQVDDVMLFTS